MLRKKIAWGFMAAYKRRKDGKKDRDVSLNNV